VSEDEHKNDLNYFEHVGAFEHIVWLLRLLASRTENSEKVIAYQSNESRSGTEAAASRPAPTLLENVEPGWRNPDLNDRMIALRTKLIQNSGLFDELFYISQLSTCLPAGVTAIEHYVTQGWVMEKDPSPLFSVKFYLAKNPDVKVSGIDPLTHYIERGSAEMRDPHPLFLNFYYASQNTDRTESGITWLARFLSEPSSQVSPHPIFEPNNYARRAGIDAGSAREALLHYLTKGWKNASDASPLFRSDFYCSQIGGSTGEIEPYTHYTLYGVPRQLSPHPLFNTRHYRKIAEEFDKNLDPLVHYFWKGESSNCDPSVVFDVEFYKTEYQSEISDRGAFWHYVTEGSDKDYQPNPYFDSIQYRSVFMKNTDQGASSAIEHFMQVGVLNLNKWSATRILPASAASAAAAARQRLITGNLLPSAAADIAGGPIPELASFPGGLPHADGQRKRSVYGDVSVR
jgi:hypothetical protein